MIELNQHEVSLVSGGEGLMRGVGVGVLGNIAYDAVKAVWQGVGSVSSSTSGFGVVGPGSRANTDVSSKDAVNGSDKQSDTLNT